MQSNRCPSCGTIGAPSDQFCENCGTRLAPTIAPYPYYPSYGPPQRNHTALIVVIVIIAVVVLVVLPAVLYVMVSGLLTSAPPGPPLSLGVVTAKLADGSAWILTFTSVPSGMTQNGTMLSVTSPSGATLLPPTTLYRLEGAGTMGVTYVPAMMGPMYTTCASGDRVILAAGTGTNQYPSGSQVSIVSGGSILFLGALQ